MAAVSNLPQSVFFTPPVCEHSPARARDVTLSTTRQPEYKSYATAAAIVTEDNAIPKRECTENPMPVSLSATQAGSATRVGAGAGGATTPATESMHRHPYEYYLVVDVEATCVTPRDPNFQQEIIEWPCVILHANTLTVVAEFQSYVRPVVNPKLSQFCTELTGITQDKVDAGKPLEETLDDFESWLRSHKMYNQDGTPKFCFLTDGPWDLHSFLHHECLRKGIEQLPHYAYWCNVRWLMAQHFHQKRLNVNRMLQHFGLTFQGREHCGLDDSRNICRIAVHLARSGCALVRNDGIDDHESVHATTICHAPKPMSSSHLRKCTTAK